MGKGKGQGTGMTSRTKPRSGALRVGLQFSLLLFPVSMASWAQAQPRAAAPQTVSLTLDQAINRAFDESHRLAEWNARVAGAAAAVDTRAAGDRPIVQVLADYTRTNHVDEFGVAVPGGAFRILYPDVPDNYRSRLDVHWPLYSGGRTGALAASARSELAAVADEREAARGDLRFDVTRAYWTLVAARANRATVDEAVRRMEAHLADVRQRLAVGLVAPSDVLTVEAQASRQRLLAIDAQQAELVAEADVRRLVGLDPGVAIEITTPLETAVAPPPPVGAVIDEARRTRPERRALAARIDAARRRQEAARNATRPIVAIAAGFDYANPNPKIFPREETWQTSWDLSVHVGWTLWNGGRSRAELAEAAAGERAVREQLLEFERLLAFEVEQRVRDLESASAAVATAEAAVRAAAEARRVVSERFGAGVATSTEVLDAQVALVQAELDRTRAFVNVHLAHARLDRAIGR